MSRLSCFQAKMPTTAAGPNSDLKICFVHFFVCVSLLIKCLLVFEKQKKNTRREPRFTSKFIVFLCHACLFTVMTQTYCRIKTDLDFSKLSFSTVSVLK